MERSRRAPALCPSRRCLVRSMGLLRVWECPFLHEIIDGLADALHNIDKGIVTCGPSSDSLAIGRENLEFGKRRSLPVGGTQDDRDDTCLVGIMPGGNDVLSPQVAQVRFQFLTECSIAMSIGDEDRKQHVNLLWWCSILLEVLYPETQQLSLRVWWND